MRTLLTYSMVFPRRSAYVRGAVGSGYCRGAQPDCSPPFTFGCHRRHWGFRYRTGNSTGSTRDWNRTNNRGDVINYRRRHDNQESNIAFGRQTGWLYCSACRDHAASGPHQSASRQPLAVLFAATHRLACQFGRHGSISRANGFEHSANVLALSMQVLVYTIVALFISWQATLTSLLIGMILLRAKPTSTRHTSGGLQADTSPTPSVNLPF